MTLRFEPRQPAGNPLRVVEEKAARDRDRSFAGLQFFGEVNIAAKRQDPDVRAAYCKMAVSSAGVLCADTVCGVRELESYSLQRAAGETVFGRMGERRRTEIIGSAHHARPTPQVPPWSPVSMTRQLGSGASPRRHCGPEGGASRETAEPAAKSLASSLRAR